MRGDVPRLRNFELYKVLRRAFVYDAKRVSSGSASSQFWATTFI
jgi:hypothetical protein